MHVAHYYLLGFFSGPAAPQTAGHGVVTKQPKRAPGKGYAFLTEVSPEQQRRARRNKQDDFITLHLLTH